jgi:hypothetical protein
MILMAAVDARRVVPSTFGTFIKVNFFRLIGRFEVCRRNGVHILFGSCRSPQLVDRIPFGNLIQRVRKFFLLGGLHVQVRAFPGGCGVGRHRDVCHHRNCVGGHPVPPSQELLPDAVLPGPLPDLLLAMLDLRHAVQHLC